MSTNAKPNAVIRATDTTRVIPGKKDPTKRWGFQSMGLLDGLGMYEKFDQIYDPEKSANFLPPGDYEVVPSGAYLDQSGHLQLGKEFVRIAPASPVPVSSPASKAS